MQIGLLAALCLATGPQPANGQLLAQQVWSAPHLAEVRDALVPFIQAEEEYLIRRAETLQALLEAERIVLYDGQRVGVSFREADALASLMARGIATADLGGSWPEGVTLEMMEATIMRFAMVGLAAPIATPDADLIAQVDRFISTGDARFRGEIQHELDRIAMRRMELEAMIERILALRDLVDPALPTPLHPESMLDQEGVYMAVIAGSGFTKFVVGARRKAGRQSMYVQVDAGRREIGRYGWGGLGVPVGTSVSEVVDFLRAELAATQAEHCPPGRRTLGAARFHPYIWEGAPQVSLLPGPMESSRYDTLREAIGPGGDGFTWDDESYTHEDAEAHCSA